MSLKEKSFSEVSKKAVQMHSIWKIDGVAFFFLNECEVSLRGLRETFRYDFLVSLQQIDPFSEKVQKKLLGERF